MFMVASMLVTGPMALLFRQALTDSIAFEQQMAKVKKAVEFSDGEAGLEKLTQRIRNLAKITPTAASQLALFAEQAGQLGIEDEGVYRYINLINKMVIGTDVMADTIAEDFGRVAAAFGMDLNTENGMRQLEKLASVLDFVAKKTSTDVNGIVTAIQDAAVIGPQLRIESKDVAVMVGMLINSGVDASAAGTVLTRFFVQVLKNADKFAKGLKGYVREIYDENGKLVDSFEPYKNMDDVIRRINTEPVLVLRDALSALYNVKDEDRAASLKNFYDSIGLVGGRIGAMASNQKQLDELLNATDEEWKNAITLQADYAAMLMTTDSQIKIAKNNLSELGMTIGSVVMPVINELASYAIPIIQDLTKAFAGLDNKTKLLVIGIPLLGAALIPVFLTLSTLAHGFTLIASGAASAAWGIGSFVINAGGVVGKLTGWFGLLRKSELALVATGGELGGVLGGLGGRAFALARAFNPLTLIVGSVTLALKALTKMGLDVSTFFYSLADRAKTWGERLMDTYSSGIVLGATRFISKAISFTANMIARFFESHSPPLEGPLADIDQWGSSLMNTYMQGFLLADFSILSEVGGRIRKAMEIMSEFGKLDGGSIPELLWAAKEGISQVISIFNETGQVAEGVLSGIGENLGTLGGDLQKMIRLWLEYNQIQKRIAELEQAKKDTLKTYDAEIARVSKLNVTAEEKAELMRQAMANRDDELRAIEQEKQAQEEAADAKKGELDWQREYIDAQLEMFDMLKDKSSGGSSSEDLMGIDFQKLEDTMSGLGDPVKDLGEEWNVVSENIANARRGIDALKRGFQGQSFTDGMSKEEVTKWQQEDPEGYKRAEELYGYGVKARDIWDKVSGTISTVTTWFGNMQDKASSAKKKLDNIANSPFIQALQKIWDAATSNIDIFGPLEGGLSELDRVLSSLGVSIGKIDFKAVMEVIVNVIAVIAGAVPIVINVVASIIEYVIKLASAMYEGILSLGEGLRTALSGLWDIIRGLLEGNYSLVLEGLAKFIGGFLEALLGFGTMIIGVATRVLEGLIVIIGRLLRDAIAYVAELFAGPEAGDAARAWFNKALDAFQAFIDKFFGMLRDWKAEIRNKVNEALSIFGGMNLSIAGALHIPDLNNDGDPGFASGAIVTKPTRAWIGEGSEPEAVLPLSKLPNLFSQMYGSPAPLMAAGAGGDTVNVYNPVVRDEKDIKKLAAEIEKILARKTKNKMRMGNG